MRKKIAKITAGMLLLACIASFCMGCVKDDTPPAAAKPYATTRPTMNPTTAVTTDQPDNTPVVTATVTDMPTDEPTVEPTKLVTEEPTDEPTAEPTAVPTEAPTTTPTPKPTATPKPTPTATPKPTATPTPKPTATPVPTPSWTEEEIETKTLYTTHRLNLRTAPDTNQDNIILCMPSGAKVKATAYTSNKWYKVTYTKNNKSYTGYAHSHYLSEVSPETQWPLVYKDANTTITIYKEWYHHAYIYSAHIVTTKYDRIGMYNANGHYHSYCTTSQAAKQLGAILCVNGDYANAPCFGLAFARHGKVYNDGECYAVGFYNNHNGRMFLNISGTPTYGRRLSTMVEEGLVTDTINFYYSVYVKNGKSTISDSEQHSNDRRPRSFVGTNGNPGDIWIFVADGDHRDGKSVGINSWERAQWALSKGCTMCVGMDGGGSSTMVFRGKRLTGGNHSERAVVDFIYFK